MTLSEDTDDKSKAVVNEYCLIKKFEKLTGSLPRIYILEPSLEKVTSLVSPNSDERDNNLLAASAVVRSTGSLKLY